MLTALCLQPSRWDFVSNASMTCPGGAVLLKGQGLAGAP